MTVFPIPPSTFEILEGRPSKISKVEGGIGKTVMFVVWTVWIACYWSYF